jgi:hypothetical protein
MRFKTGIKIDFEEITGIRSQVPAIFSENSEVVLGDFNYFFDLVLQMGANGASCQELKIAPKNRFHTIFLDKGRFLLLQPFTFHSVLTLEFL